MTWNAPEVAMAAGAGVVVVASLLWSGRGRRGLARRLHAVAVRLEEEHGSDDRRSGVERTLARVERAADRAVTRVGDAKVEVRRLAVALDAVPVGVVVGDERGDPVFHNRHAAPFVDPGLGEVLAERAMAECLRGAAGGEARTRNIELYGPPHRTLVMSAVPIEDDWRGIGAVAVVEDVSERRRLETIGRDFVADVDHELKVPLGSLAVLAETLATEEDVEVGRRLASRLQSDARRLADVIGDLLELSRVESERSPRREPVAVHAVVAQAVGRVRALVASRDVSVAVAPISRRLTVPGDRHQLVTALAQVLENAVACSARGASVEVEARLEDEPEDGDAPVEGAIERSGHPLAHRWVEIAVQDHGIGLPAEELDRIFERFYRVERARPRGRRADPGGSGLGLAIVREVMVAHGGEVEVSSSEGEGARFTLRLPAGPAAIARKVAEGA
ncbi:MAG: sensor histidine kinase [Acidimicrobiales bacterium]